MRLQPAGPSVAIPKRMHPGKTVMRAGDGDQLRIQAKRLAIHLVGARQKGGHGAPCRRLMAAHGHIFLAQYARLHDVTIIRGAIVQRQTPIKCGMRLPQEVAAQNLGFLAGKLLQFTLGIHVHQRDALALSDIGLV